MIIDCVLRDLAIEQGQVFRQPVKLTHASIDRRSLIVRQRLSSQPLSTASVKKISMRTSGSDAHAELSTASVKKISMRTSGSDAHAG